MLIALAIFTIIGIASVKQISQIQNTKEAAFRDIDLYNNTRSAMSVIRQDLSQSFHVLYDDLGEASKTLLLQGKAISHTLFDGRKKELVFTSLSHRVYYEGRKESEQTEISYFLQRKPKNKNPSLMKREAPLIDEDGYKGGTIFTIIDNVSDIEFAYWDDKQEKWVDDWNSDGGNYRDRFPLAVKVKLTVQSEEGKTLVADTLIKVAFANNQAVTVQL